MHLSRDEVDVGRAGTLYGTCTTLIFATLLKSSKPSCGPLPFPEEA